MRHIPLIIFFFKCNVFFTLNLVDWIEYTRSKIFFFFCFLAFALTTNKHCLDGKDIHNAGSILTVVLQHIYVYVQEP